MRAFDAYTHFFPEKFFTKLNEVAGDYKDMGKRIRSLPALVRSQRAQEDRRRPQGLSADPVLSAAADREIRQDADRHRRVLQASSMTASPN